MNIDEMFPSKFLRAGDLAGNPMMVTIGGIAADNISGEKKVVMTFSSGQKALILNKTNGKALAKMFGKELSAWIGKQIVLVPTEVDFKGDMVEAIRIRAPRAPAATAADGLSDEIPF